MVYLPIDTYKKDLDEVLFNIKLKYDWEDLYDHLYR